jgi:D-alanyl-D-alanine dipeptidase
MKIGSAVAAVFIVVLPGINCASSQAGIPLVDVKSADSTIVVDLRYAGANNIVGHPLYPAGTHALVRPELLPRLRAAQKFLRQYNYRLKIWDAYRPASAQRALWHATQDDNYVANPDLAAGSLHTWGVAVDCSLTDLHNRDVRMPTDFDDFTPAAMSFYTGPNFEIRSRLRLLQVGMAAAGFYAFRNEWWHFTVKNWPKYLPAAEARRVVRIFGSPAKENL